MLCKCNISRKNVLTAIFKVISLSKLKHFNLIDPENRFYVFSPLKFVHLFYYNNKCIFLN